MTDALLVLVVLGFAGVLPVGALLAGSLPQQVPEGGKVYKDIEYAKPDGKPQLLDLFVPEKAGGPLPLVIWVHGGCWSMGNKQWQPIPALSMTAHGYAVATINYRLSGEAKWPAQIHDCKAAVRFLRAHARDYHLDPERFGAWGSSAGGHLVAMLGTAGGVKELEGDLGNPGVSSRVQAVCDWFGPSDFLTIGKFPSNIKHDSADGPEGKLFGKPIHENEAMAKQASPTTYITKDDPPFLVMHGDKDMTVPYSQSEELAAALKKAGVWVKFITVPGGGHGMGPAQTPPVYEFFDEKLKGKR